MSTQAPDATQTRLRGTTTLVLLPGIDGTGVFFQPLLKHLPAWVDPLVKIYPQYGRTGYADLLKWLDSVLPTTGEFFILGWSFGGPLALMLAAMRPGQVRGIVLCASFVQAPRPALRRWRWAALPPLVWSLRVLWRSRFLLTGYPSRAFRDAKAQTWRLVRAHALAARVREALNVDARDLLRQYQGPMLYLASSHDHAVPKHNALEIATLVPNIELATLDGPHLALFTDAERAAILLGDFMQRHSEPAGPDSIPDQHQT